MARKNGARGRRANGGVVVFEAMEGRRYFAASFGTPSTFVVDGARGSVEVLHSSFGGIFPAMVVATSSTIQVLGDDSSFTSFGLGVSILLPSNSASGTPFVVGNFASHRFS